jgi:hypothetical protein
MKTLHRVMLAAVPLATAGVLLTPVGPAAGSAGWMVSPAAPAAHAICAMARLPYRTPAVADARGLLDGLAKFTSSRLDGAWTGIGVPVAATGSGRPTTTARVITRSAASGFPSAGGSAVPARSRSCL